MLRGALFQRSELVRTFRSAAFAADADVDAFVAAAGDVSSADVVKLLPIVAELSKAAPAAHARRCDAFAKLAKKTPRPADLFVPCLRTMRTADPVFLAVLGALAPQINDVGAFAEVVELLDSPDPPVRAVGADVLHAVGGKSALELLTERARTPAFRGRMEAISALASRAGQHALPLLQATLLAGRPHEKIHALRQLADPTRFRDLAPVVEIISSVLQDPDDLVLAQAIHSLGALDLVDFVERVEVHVARRGIDPLRAFLTHALKRADESTAAMLRDRLRAGPRSVRIAVIEAIQGAGSDVFFPTLVEALSHVDVSVRTRAAHAITELSKSSRINVARAVVWLLKSRDVNVRRLAAEIATSVPDPEYTLAPRLLESLRDEDWWVRERVLDALVEMNTPRVTKHIVKDYLADPSGVVRRFAVSALMRIGDPRTLGALVRTAQDDEDWLVADLAVEAIGVLADQRAVAYLIELISRRPELRLPCVLALRRLKATEAVPDVAELVQDPDPAVRAAAIVTLDELDDGSHALWVKGLEEDASEEVRDAARRLLRKYKLLQEKRPIAETRSLDALLHRVIEQGADDLFLVPGEPPYVKHHGRIRQLDNETGPMTDALVRTLIEPRLNADQIRSLAAKREVDFSVDLKNLRARFRANVFHQVSGVSAVLRTVSVDVPTLDNLGLPPILASFARLPHGLVLVGGPTGAGKSTTLAAIIDHINRNLARHIVTIEDPVEVLHVRHKSLVTQRELGPHTRSLRSALRSALRQDPDVILVGELRDRDTIAFAVSAAETGHLVLGTVHTTSADATIDRLINAFPSRQQAQVRSMLAESLRAVTCQYLLRTESGARLPAVEVMIANDAIQSLIRKGKTFQIPTVMATSREQGMQMMDADLIRLAKSGTVIVDDAYAKALDKAAFEIALGLPRSNVDMPPTMPPASSAHASDGPPSRAPLSSASAPRGALKIPERG
ncbi:MAG: PilT/PilU family type 4a pilus ATPase [Polyangiaceae bacterium]